MDLNIRPATKDDLPAIVEIYNNEILHGTATFHTEPQMLEDRANWLSSLQAGQYPCLVAEVDAEGSVGKRTIGWCSLGHYVSRPAYNATAQLSLYVHKDFRSKGVGEKLLERTIEVTRSAGDRFHAIIASVATDNPRRTKFWASHGFELRGTIKEVGYKFGKWLDVSYYQLML